MASTPLRNFRAPDDVWEAAQARAAAEGTTLSAELLKFLESYGGVTAGPLRPGPAPAQRVR